MHASDVGQACWARIRRPGRTGVLLLVALAWAPLRLVIDMPYGRFGRGEAFLPLALLLGSLLLAPMAWQWTGTEARLSAMGRGLLQSLAWNGAWLLMLILGVRGLVDRSRLQAQPQAQPKAPVASPPPAETVPPQWRESASKWTGSKGAGATPPPSPELQLWSLGLLLGTVLGRVVAEREAVEAREAALRIQTDRARSLALQSQMQPHALFNALSGLVELAQEDPEATELALIALCDYLRRLMDHGRADAAPLREERRLLEDYLRIEQLRLGDSLDVSWDWPSWADDLVLPPLLLQPLVENAILHGIAVRAEGGALRISAARKEGRVCLQVENTGRPPEDRPAGGGRGLGLGHLRQRLALWAGDTASLRLERVGDWTQAVVTLPPSLGR